MLDLIQKGGPLMILLIVCSLFTLTIFIERMIHFYCAKINARAFLQYVKEMMEDNRIQEALDFCRKTPGPIAHIFGVGLLKYDRTREEMTKAMDVAAAHEVVRLEKNLNMMATIAYIAPLLGLLGTVSGMIAAFQVIQDKAASGLVVNPGDLAGGIWEALITTAAGLIVAIPSYVAYNYLISRVDHMIVEMEENVEEMIDVLISGRGADAH
ncbi:hypothetical protein AB834_01110 [PVC group bacterium (ex Bugula neritina AB1)]|nr:hypothetical protein AB834_01110 [PVC group bacterium (ex Bugula neritina AB1)]